VQINSRNCLLNIVLVMGKLIQWVKKKTAEERPIRADVVEMISASNGAENEA